MNKKLTCMFLSASILLSGGAVLASLPQDIYNFAWAASDLNPENSNVLDDLMGDSDFKRLYNNGSTYAIDASKDEMNIIALYEYQYKATSSFTLYIYVFNKSGKGSEKYNFAYNNNRIQMLQQNTGSYEHFNITFLNKTDDNRFLKYKCVINDSQYVINGDSRDYSISGIEIGYYTTEGGQTLTHLKDYSVSHSWKFYTDNGQLKSEYADELIHLEPEVSGGAYRTESANVNSWTGKNDLFYVYFNVPATFDGENYDLYSIHADYYKFNLANKLYALVDEHNADYYLNVANDIYNNGNISDAKAQSYKNQFYDNEHLIAHAILDPAYDYFYNMNSALLSGYYCDTTNWFRRSHTAAGNTHPDVWYYGERSYDNLINYNNGSPIIDKVFYPVSSATESVDGWTVGSTFDLDKAEAISGQTRNNVYHNIHLTADNTFDLEQYGNNHNGWDNFWRAVFNGGNPFAGYTDYDINDIKAIEKVSKANASMSDADFIDKYLVSEKDASKLKSKLTSSLLSNQNIYLFRFDTALYDSAAIGYSAIGMNGLGEYVYLDYLSAGYVATAYTGIIDFDIIDLTFVNKYGKTLIVPVVHDPQNIMPDLDPPSVGGIDSIDLWGLIRKILAIVGIVLGILVVIWLLSKAFGIGTQVKARRTYREIKNQNKKRK